uniref:Ovule protein n=1 Tax=Ascaris lumbricoides TaxID=6252 RepID=A0A0M3ITV8_ASCLU
MKRFTMSYVSAYPKFATRHALVLKYCFLVHLALREEESLKTTWMMVPSSTIKPSYLTRPICTLLITDYNTDYN